jgi:peptidoglycan hydrolase FlgJ
MDTAIISQNTGSIEAGRESRDRQKLANVENLSKSFVDEMDKAIDEKKEPSAYEKAKEKRSKKLMDACVEAESLFVAQMLKQMRSTVTKGEMLHGGQTEEIFEDMLYDQYALSISKSANLGIAKMMYQQLSKAM